jgi:hypothetical protein
MYTNQLFSLTIQTLRRILSAFGISILVSLSLAQAALAVSSDFTVRTLIGDDTIPPTVPAPITATPVAQSQIDLTWGTSTDNYLLSGYQVFRDAVQIATTTSTSYSDVGLYASTTYTYYVTAFDFFNNISASSSLVATTTFATPTPPVTPTTTTSSGTTYGSKIRLPELVSLEVIPSQYGAIIRFETEGHVRSIVRWGTSISYELGSSVERSFSKFHEMAITDLRPGTRYRFSIEGENHMGRFGTLTESTFTTLSPNDTFPPGLVIGLTATRDGGDIVLRWQNPRDPDFDHVRVVRSESFYPSDEVDGWVVFDGGATEARDRGVALPGARLFYSVFTYDENGNISSAAVVAIRIPTTGGSTEPVVPIDMHDGAKNEIALTLDDVDFYQDEQQLLIERGTVTMNGSRHLTIAVPYDALPEHLKTILVTMTPAFDPEKELQFILKINAERTAYTARLAPLGVAGDFMVRVSVFDFKTAQIGYTQGRITSVISNFTTNEDEAFTEEVSSLSLIVTFLTRNYIIFFIFFLILLAFLARQLLHRRNDTLRVSRE